MRPRKSREDAQVQTPPDLRLSSLLPRLQALARPGSAARPLLKAKIASVKEELIQVKAKSRQDTLNYPAKLNLKIGGLAMLPTSIEVFEDLFAAGGCPAREMAPDRRGRCSSVRPARPRVARARGDRDPPEEARGARRTVSSGGDDRLARGGSLC